MKRMTIACATGNHDRCPGQSPHLSACACVCHHVPHSDQAPDPTPCPHDAWSGAEGPVAALGRMPTRWSCDGCGIDADERPVCLSCARDTYPGLALEQSFPDTARECHVCGMTTLLGYAVPKGAPVRAADPTPCPECAVGKHGNCDGRTWDRDADGYTDCPCAGAGHG